MTDQEQISKAMSLLAKRRQSKLSKSEKKAHMEMMTKARLAKMKARKEGK